MREEFKINLKQLLKDRDVTQSELATEIGVSRGTMSDWLSGRFYPRPKYIEAIADYFGVDAAELTRNKKKQPTIIDDELQSLFLALSPEKQEQVKEYALFLLRSRP